MGAKSAREQYKPLEFEVILQKHPFNHLRKQTFQGRS